MLDDESKQAYNVEAEHQQILRERLGSTPLAAACPKKESQSQPPGFDVDDQNQDVSPELSVKAMEAEVGRKACGKLSCRRLALSQSGYQSHLAWTTDSHFGDSSLVSHWEGSEGW